MSEAIIADTSPLIALERIDLLSIICKIYSDVIIPEAVIKEFGNLSLPCCSVKKVEGNLLKLLVADLNLGKGEAEVITLASQTGLKVIIDDSRARRIAENMGLTVIGTIGILLKAEKVGLIASANIKIKELRSKGFYVADELLEKVSRFNNS